MNEAVEFDVAIVGGGLIGASLARALSHQSLRVAVIEAVPYGSADQPSFDDRTLALSYGTRRIFEGLGIWHEVAATGATAIRTIHVSDRGHAGITHLEAQREGVEALGYVATSRVLGKVLTSNLSSLPGLTLMSPAILQDMMADETGVTLQLQEQDQVRSLRARLVVAADGARSTARALAGISAAKKEYGQCAVIANVAVERFHDNVAYERFTETGPLALLPAGTTLEHGGYRMALVWTVAEQDVPALLAMDDTQFLDGLSQRFGSRLGRFCHAGTRHSYPLILAQAQQHTARRTAIIGNAAHTLHPIAGQGFNLGLRDVAALAQVIVDAQRAGEDIGSEAVLQRYAAWRQRDQRQVITFTDGLVRLFSNDFLPLVVARNIGLVITELLPPLKHFLSRRAMGLSGRLPRLARGLPL